MSSTRRVPGPAWGKARVPLKQSTSYLQVQVEDVHLVHVSYPLAYLPDEQDGVELRQVAVVVDDAIEELASVHAAGERGRVLTQRPRRAPAPRICAPLTRPPAVSAAVSLYLLDKMPLTVMAITGAPPLAQVESLKAPPLQGLRLWGGSTSAIS